MGVEGQRRASRGWVRSWAALTRHCPGRLIE
jgi:hypothetical protein